MSNGKYTRKKGNDDPPYDTDFHFYRDYKDWIEGGDPVDKSLFLSLSDVPGDHTKTRLDDLPDN